MLKVRQPLPANQGPSSGYGWRFDPFNGERVFHAGLDLRAEHGAPIVAAAAGRFCAVEERHPFYGKMVEIDHGAGVHTRYAHASSIMVSEGQDVQAGAVVAEVGRTGRSTGSHLHFELRINGKAVDPRLYLGTGRAIQVRPRSSGQAGGAEGPESWQARVGGYCGEFAQEARRQEERGAVDGPA
ncbi:MAG: M23 family metallopeptidase [Candidatus Protistobacter heckmanni]|nr:M23 family metallopeptidase [Candidatus Protistobacter heckmanni]